MGFIKKVSLLGDPAVGKTSIIQRYVNDKFQKEYLTTIGTKPSVMKLDHQGIEVNLTIWDIAGQETFQNIHSSYYKGAAGAVLVCDITRPETIISLTRWKTGFKAICPDSPVIVVSNKWDLVDENRCPTQIEMDVRIFAEEEGSKYFRCSAKDDLSIKDVFINLLAKMMR